MAGVRYKSRLDEQIDIEKEKKWKIEEENNVFQSLKDDQEKLKELENGRFSRKILFLIIILQHFLICQ